jgi:type I restriction enzyme, S subunit
VSSVGRTSKGLLPLLNERRSSVIALGARGMLQATVPTHDIGLAWAPTVRKPWRRVKIKYVAQLGTGHTPSRTHEEYWEDCNIPWITTGEISQVRDDRTEVIAQTRERISELG